MTGREVGRSSDKIDEERRLRGGRVIARKQMEKEQKKT